VDDVLPKPEAAGLEEGAAKALGCVAGVGFFAAQGEAELADAEAPKGDVALGAAEPKGDAEVEANEPKPELLNLSSEVRGNVFAGASFFAASAPKGDAAAVFAKPLVGGIFVDVVVFAGEVVASDIFTAPSGLPLSRALFTFRSSVLTASVLASTPPTT
jgi:hypothetical protein